MQYVGGVLVDGDRAGRERDIIVSAIWKRNQRRQRRRGRITDLIGRYGRLIGLRDYRAVLQEALVLAQSFVTPVEECVVSPDRTAYRAAVVVALQRGFIAGGAEGNSGSGINAAIEVVARVECFVAEVVEGLAVELVCAGTRGDGHNRAITAAVLRAEGGVIDFELGGGADRGLKGDLILGYIVEIDAVDLEVHRIFAVACRDEGVGAEAAAGRGKVARRVRHHASRRKHRQVEEVTAVERKVLHRISVDDLADGRSEEHTSELQSRQYL